MEAVLYAAAAFVVGYCVVRLFLGGPGKRTPPSGA